MSKPKPIAAVIDAAQIGARPQPERADTSATVRRLFMLFHGWYGNLLIARYNTGEVGLDGKDRGVNSAMKVWQAELTKFEAQDIEAAVKRCEQDCPKYPPTLPEFLALCRAVRVRPIVQTSGPMKIQMSGGLRSSYTTRARAQAMASYRAKMEAETDVVNVGSSVGLPALQQLIAQAVALAGGDEVAVLRRFDEQRSAK